MSAAEVSDASPPRARLVLRLHARGLTEKRTPTREYLYVHVASGDPPSEYALRHLAWGSRGHIRGAMRQKHSADVGLQEVLHVIVPRAGTK